jgi:hypothetical protein
MEQKITEELLHEIENIQKIEDYLGKNDNELITGQLHDYMAALLKSKTMKIIDIVRGSNLNRVYVYQIFAGKKLPSRDKVIALGFGFRLDFDGMQRYLKQAGHRELYARDKRDAVIIFSLNRGMDIYQTNELMYGLSEPIIE